MPLSKPEFGSKVSVPRQGGAIFQSSGERDGATAQVHEPGGDIPGEGNAGNRGQCVLGIGKHRSAQSTLGARFAGAMSIVTSISADPYAF